MENAEDSLLKTSVVKLKKKFVTMIPLEAVTRKDLALDFGEDARNCISARLKSAADLYSQKKGVEVCLGTWLREAYADSLYLDQWIKPTAFSLMCGDNLHHPFNSDHGPTDALECVMNRSPFRNSFCGQKEECKK